eukprot:6197498-Pleurochrysis_carterae.AAC.1
MQTEQANSNEDKASHLSSRSPLKASGDWLSRFGSGADTAETSRAPSFGWATEESSWRSPLPTIE